MSSRYDWLVGWLCASKVTAILTDQSEDRLYIVQEFVPHGELYEVLTRMGGYGEEEGADFIRYHAQLFTPSQILTAVEYLHKQGIVHRDLKPVRSSCPNPPSRTYCSADVTARSSN